MILHVAAFLLITYLTKEIKGSPFGPKYPITASLFQDRFSSDLWNDALTKFAEEGGNTVWLEGPPLVRRTKSDLQEDPVFKWCHSSGSALFDTPNCFDQAETELKKYGMKIRSFASYQYEENFSDIIMQCPIYDRKIVTVNTYYRLVLPTKYDQKDPCQLNGSDVIVIFTSLSGQDPHELLLQTAKPYNFSVYFGLPRVPRTWGQGFDSELMPAYYGFVQRVLKEHKVRYSNKNQTQNDSRKNKKASKTLYDVIKGYYSADSCNLGSLSDNNSYIQMYLNLSKIIKSTPDKQFAVAPNIDLTKFGLNKTVGDHANGLKLLTNASIDVIAVHEGRGYGNAAYYWPTERDQPIKLVDPILDMILAMHAKSWKTNGTFRDAYTGSVHELFAALSDARNEINRNSSTSFELWLGVEAFENLHDEVCLPIAPVHPHPPEVVIDRTSKSRIDRALTHGSAHVQGAVAFSWDPDFTCTTKSHKISLAEEIRTDVGRPIVVDCFLHSQYNRSVVVIGFNLDAETQGFHLDWPDRDGRRHSDYVHGYYFELDYGVQHDVIPSMEYVQMWDAYDVSDLDDKGYIIIKADTSYHECAFTYDYTTE